MLKLMIVVALLVASAASAGAERLTTDQINELKQKCGAFSQVLAKQRNGPAQTRRDADEIERLKTQAETPSQTAIDLKCQTTLVTINNDQFIACRITVEDFVFIFNPGTGQKLYPEDEVMIHWPRWLPFISLTQHFSSQNLGWSGNPKTKSCIITPTVGCSCIIRNGKPDCPTQNYNYCQRTMDAKKM